MNYLSTNNSATGNGVSLFTSGSDTDVDLIFGAQAAGLVRVSSAGLSGSKQGIYVGLDTPVSLVSSTSTSSTNWTTVNNATLNSAAPAIAKLRIQTSIQSAAGTTGGVLVDIAKSGQSGALTSNFNTPTVYTSNMLYVENSGGGFSRYSTSEIDVNLDGSYDFQYGTLVSSTGALSGVYVNIILVGYYV